MVYELYINIKHISKLFLLEISLKQNKTILMVRYIIYIYNCTPIKTFNDRVYYSINCILYNMKIINQFIRLFITFLRFMLTKKKYINLMEKNRIPKI